MIENKSGFKPVILPKNSRMLAYICELGEQKSQGGLILRASYTEEEAYKQTTGILVEIIHSNEEDKNNCSAKIGDKLSFKPYAGIHKVGKDCKAYRLLDGYEVHSIEE